MAVTCGDCRFGDMEKLNATYYDVSVQIKTDIYGNRRAWFAANQPFGVVDVSQISEAVKRESIPLSMNTVKFQQLSLSA